MRILTYLPRLEAAGGIEIHLLQMSRELSRRGHVIDMCYAEDGNLSETFGAFCASLTQIPRLEYAGGALAYLRDMSTALRRAGHLRPDVVHVNKPTELPWAAAMSAIFGAPIVCCLHTFYDYPQGYIGARVVPLLARRVFRFVAVSESIRERWKATSLKHASIDVVPNGIALSDYPEGSAADLLHTREALGLPADAYVALYLGRIVPEKGVDVLLDAWRQIGASADQARLLIAGVPPDPADRDEYLRGLQADAPPGCEWLAMAPDIVDLLHAADVVVLPARWEEPFGRVLIEAMATGRPALGAAVGGVPSVLTGEFARFLFPKEDAAGLAQQLRQLRHWRTVDPGLAERCVTYVDQTFSLQETASQMEAILASATARRRRRRRR
jgi:glycosyltransferase involved in cell wall biosynthesis